MKKVCLQVLCFMHQLCLGINLAYRAADSKSQCGDAINAQIEFLTTKHNNLSFSRRLKIWEGHTSPLSDNQRKEAANVFLGISNSDVVPPLLLDDDEDRKSVV